MQTIQTLKRIAVILTTALVAACGGGGGGSAGSDGTPVTTLSGTAAVGYPIVNAMVTVRCAAGTPPTATITDSNGAWSVDAADQTLPCAVALNGGTANGVANSTQYHSVAMARGVVNITPMTDLLVANLVQSPTPSTWFGDLETRPELLAVIKQTQVDASLKRLRDAMPLVQPLAELNPITHRFTPTAGQPMDDMLEALAQARTEIGVSHAFQLAAVAVAGAIPVNEIFTTAVVWKFRGTRSGGNANYASSMVLAPAPTPTYPDGSEEAYAFQFLNAERSRCGFGTLVQNTQIDSAAQAHADWGLLNWVFSHYEDNTQYPLGYTGYDPFDRIAYQGYPNLRGAGEVMAGTSGISDKFGKGIAHMRGLLSAPFHLNTLTYGFRDLGLSVRSNIDAGSVNRAVYSVADFAYKQNSELQRQSSSSILTYPCDGTTGVNFRLRHEDPNPVPGRNLAAFPLGHPVLVRVRDSNILSISNATMRNWTTDELVTLRSVATTKADDPHGYFHYNEAYVIPDEPLSPNTAYEVTIAGTNSSVPFTRTFMFSTGSGG